MVEDIIKEEEILEEEDIDIDILKDILLIKNQNLEIFLNLIIKLPILIDI